MTAILLSLLATPALALDRPAEIPAPLEAPPLSLPDPEIGQLSNGIEVRVAPNHEVPLWEVRLLIGVGSYADPASKEGLASMTFDMVDEGAGERDAVAMATELKRLASSVGASSEAVSASITASGIKRSMAGTLDIWTDVIRAPRFPADRFATVHSRHMSDLALAATNPQSITRNVWRHLVWGDGYIGRHATQESLGTVTLDEVKGFYTDYVNPANAIILVGGDVTLDEVLPLLEARLGDWTVADGKTAPVKAEAMDIEAETIYLVDNPGAAQSVVQSATIIGSLDDADYFNLLVGNKMFGGDFTGRINMNLREDKGYTYGANCWVSHRHGPGQYGCGARVRTDVTGASLMEFRGEIAGMLGDAGMTEEEMRRGADSLAYGWPGRFETTGPQLDLEFEIWRYGKSEDWAADYIPNIRSVTPEAAQAAMAKWVQPEHTFWLVVGDKAAILEDLQGLGLPIVELDPDGQPLTDE
jgi:zinc protease